jgi:hypothetical protein
MSAEGWRKRHIADLRSEIDEFEEVIANRILIEEEIAMIEAMIIKSIGDVNSQMGVDLDASLMIAREKLRNLK